jgi:formylglycine-generating enzyme required for sulfatase activity
LSSNTNPTRDAPKLLTIYLGKRKANALTMAFRPIPAGTFWMGSNYSRLSPALRESWDFNAEPRHQVQLSKFYLGQFPVTQQEFRVWTDAADIKHSNDSNHDDAERYPAENMTWHQALEFCEWLNAKILPLKENAHFTGCIATLPSEAQWEYACRGVKPGEVEQPLSRATEYYNGDGEAALAQIGWYDANAEDDTHPVESTPSGEPEHHPFGLQQMHGNVWEWCLDAWDEQAYRKRPALVSNPLVMALNDEELQQRVDKELLRRYWPQRSPESADRVVRGGSWYSHAGWCRSAYRLRRRPDFVLGNLGFRVCLVPDPGPAFAGLTSTADQQQSDSQGAERGAVAQSGADRLEGGSAQDRAMDARSAQSLRDFSFPKRE